MAKKIDAYIKLQVPAGDAKPAPPVGPALGQHGLNIMDFRKFPCLTVDSQAGKRLTKKSKEAGKIPLPKKNQP